MKKIYNTYHKLAQNTAIVLVDYHKDYPRSTDLENEFDYLLGKSNVRKVHVYIDLKPEENLYPVYDFNFKDFLVSIFDNIEKALSRSKIKIILHYNALQMGYNENEMKKWIKVIRLLTNKIYNNCADLKNFKVQQSQIDKYACGGFGDIELIITYLPINRHLCFGKVDKTKGTNILQYHSYWPHL